MSINVLFINIETSFGEFLICCIDILNNAKGDLISCGPLSTFGSTNDNEMKKAIMANSKFPRINNVNWNEVKSFAIIEPIGAIITRGKNLADTILPIYFCICFSFLPCLSES